MFRILPLKRGPIHLPQWLSPPRHSAPPLPPVRQRDRKGGGRQKVGIRPVARKK
jgi:hypothetical protein